MLHSLRRKTRKDKKEDGYGVKVTLNAEPANDHRKTVLNLLS
jgi:hypothetical protein